MSSLVNQIQQAILGSTDDHEHLRSLLRELQIPANAPRDPDALRKIRRCLLWSQCSVEEMRAAFAGLGLTGGGGGSKSRALRNIRKGILYDL